MAHVGTSDLAGPSERPVGVWLLAVALLVGAMVLLGGATRLTHSGLSMVDWRPVTGWLPPLSGAEWRAAFESYKLYPEYLAFNRGMSLGEFQAIFWFEYSHRLLGRLIGLAFAVPFLWFLIRRRIPRRRAPALAGLFLLGALQGGIGWWMVQSGLVERPDVSHLRLALHLGLAVAIFGALLWVGLDMLGVRGQGAAGRPRGWAWLALMLVYLQILLGALVAGLDAGFIYNTFPLMGGHWLPPEAWELTPVWRNAIDNPVAVQFLHRVGAVVTALAVIMLWARHRDGPAAAALGLVVAQFALGVLTLAWLVPVPLGLAHQAGALLLFAVTLLVAKRG